MKISEKIIESFLYTCGTITTTVVLLICIFLFREGLGLFSEKQIENGFVIVVHPKNPVNHLSESQIRSVFNQDIVNWRTIGGKDEPILLFQLSDAENNFSAEQIGKNLENLADLTSKFISENENIIAAIPQGFLNKNQKEIPVEKIKFTEFLVQKDWYPTSQPVPVFGTLPILLGTLWVCAGALLVAIPLGLAVAIYLAEIAGKHLRNTLQTFIELLAGIPSVVLGFFGLAVVVPFIQQLFNLSVGETALAGSLMLGLISLPLIITLSQDAIRSVPVSLKEASLALGATHWQTIQKVILPHAVSGIMSSVVLAVGRTVGETMCVLMLTGNANLMPVSFLQPVRTITATIAAELGEAPYGGNHFKALFMLACILFVITFLLNLLGESLLLKRKN